MKSLFAICMILISTLVSAAENMSPPATVKGDVLEIKEVQNFTYLRLKTDEGEVWAAVVNAHVEKGAKVTIENVTVMSNFESKSLNKTFPTILFGSLGAAATSESGLSGISKYMSVAHPGLAQTPPPQSKLPQIRDAIAPQTVQNNIALNAKIPKASGANALTVEEIVTKGAALKGKPVLVRGKVVKYNPGIMGKNWIHLRDGSGIESNNTNDILVTTSAQTKVGDVVTVKGVIGTEKDFGAGYFYKILIEEATLQQ